MHAAPLRPSPRRPIPWIGLLLVLACLGVSLRAQLADTTLAERRLEAHRAARAYFLDHPYLDPGPAIERMVSPAELLKASEAHQAERRRAGFVAVPEKLRQHRQRRLDGLLAEASGEFDPGPAHRLGALPADGPSLRWLGYALLHPSPWLLVGNALLLLFLAVYLEPLLARWGFGLTAVAAVFAGAAAYAVALPGQSQTALVGSAPLACALWLAFAVTHWRRRGEGFYEVGLVLGAAWLALPPWLGLRWSLVELDLFSRAQPAPDAVLAGSCAAAALVGLAAGVAALRLGRDPALGEAARGAHPLLRRALRSRAAGRPREALEDLRELQRLEPENRAAALGVWELCREIGRNGEVSRALVRLTHLELRQDHPDALEHWEELTRSGIPLGVPPGLMLSASLALRGQGRLDAAAEALRCALERSEDRDSRTLAAHIARAARGLDPEIVETAAWRALGSMEITLEQRQALEDLIAEVIPLRPAQPAARPAPAPPPPQDRGAADELESGAGSERSLELASERTLAAVEATPRGFGDEGLDIETPDGRKRLGWDRVEAVAMAAVEGLGPKHVMLIDLVLNWHSSDGEPLRVIRLRGDRFDPRRLVGREGSSVEALRELMETILERTGAEPLPDEPTVLGRPFASFPDRETYESAVLRVDGEASGA